MQQDKISPYFSGINIMPYLAQVDNPDKGIGVPPDYKFLQTKKGPVEFLPVVILTGPRLPRKR